MADLRKLKDRAAELAAKGKLEKAAEVYREVLAGDPRDVTTLQKLAEVLRRAGDTARAVEAYRAVADRFGRDGLLVKAIAICKTILELEPEHAATQAALAELYASRARADQARPPQRATLFMAAVKAVPAPPPPAGEPEDRHVELPLPPAPPAGQAVLAPPPPAGPAPFSDAATPLAEIVSAAHAAADAGVVEDVVLEIDPLDQLDVLEGPPPTSPALDAEPALPRVPIFSDLSREAFLALTAGMILHRVERGASVLREGDEGKSFYVVASGTLAVSKRDERGDQMVLARLSGGEFFGEMALLSGAPRSATVTAEEPSEVLEIGAELLLGLARRHPHLAESLQRFYRQRLLANALALSPVFRPFGRGDRKLIMERFRARSVAAGEVIVREGSPSDGLYVILEGAVDVVKRADGRERVVGNLREGDLFGELSCLRKTPATATVTVRRGGTLLRLPRKAFDELVTAYPQILELVSELSDERLENLDAILSGHAEWTEDGLVLI